MKLAKIMAALLIGLAFSIQPLLAGEAVKKGGTLVWSIFHKPRHFNPAVQSGIATGQPGAQIFATPLRFDENWNPQPYLAESWSVSEDNLSVTLNLVKGATFHDGKPITSEDVAFSIDVVKKNHPFKTMFAAVSKVDTPDAHTATIRLSKPHPALFLAMSSQLLSIIPKHIYGDGQDVKKHPRNSKNVVGSGPFKMVEYKRGQHIILEKYENFFIKGRPYVDKIVMRIMGDANARQIALENGEVHLSSFESNPAQVNNLKKASNVVVTDKGYAAIGPLQWLAFNTKHKPLDDVRVRKAIAYAVDRDYIVNGIMQGIATPAFGPITRTSPLALDSIERYNLDLAKANALLDEAGLKKGTDGIRFELTVIWIPSAMQKAMAEYLVPQLKKIGIKITPRNSPDFPTWAKRMATKDFHLAWDVVFNWGDPVIGVHRTYSSKNIREQVWSNTQSYANPKVDELMEKAGMATDPAKRKKLYSEFQKIVANELPVYWTNALPYHTVYSKKVGNPPSTIWGTSSPLDEIYLK